MKKLTLYQLLNEHEREFAREMNIRNTEIGELTVKELRQLGAGIECTENFLDDELNALSELLIRIFRHE